jgi:hypothetical protein
MSWRGSSFEARTETNNMLSTTIWAAGETGYPRQRPDQHPIHKTDPRWRLSGFCRTQTWVQCHVEDFPLNRVLISCPLASLEKEPGTIIFFFFFVSFSFFPFFLLHATFWPLSSFLCQSPPLSLCTLVSSLLFLLVSFFFVLPRCSEKLYIHVTSNGQP